MRLIPQTWLRRAGSPLRFSVVTSLLLLGGWSTPASAQAPRVPAIPMQAIGPASQSKAKSQSSGAVPSTLAARDTSQKRADASPEVQATELSAALKEALEGALALGESADVDQLLRSVQIVYGEALLLTKALSAIIIEESKAAQDALEPIASGASRKNKPKPSFSERCEAAWWLAGSIERRIGNLRNAQHHFDELIDSNNSIAAHIERASLLDARGKDANARRAYERLLKRLLGNEKDVAAGAIPAAIRSEDLTRQIDTIRLRLAFFSKESGDERGSDLVEFAADRDDAMKRRAAIVLGLQGAPAKALELYVVEEEEAGEGPSTSRFRQEARMAEWAIQAGDPPQAQQHAWNAALSAKLGRDRNYAMTLLVESYRLDESISILIDRFKEASDTGELTHEARSVWVELLREEGRIDEAIELFADSGNTDETLIGKTADLAAETQRKLIEIYREDDRTDEMVAAYRERIDAEPERLSWREGLSRFFLERGDQDKAEAVWTNFVEGADLSAGVFDEETLLLGFSILSDLGLDDLAIASANRAIEMKRGHLSACLHLFNLHQERGRLDLAEAALEKLAEMAAPDEPARLDLAEAWERLGRLDRAVEVLEGIVEVRGAAESGEDLAMHLAWLYSEVGDEEKAMDSWLELWTRINALSRRRYVEDRLMTVASRLGTLADIAIDLEQKLLDGSADERETGLLVRLYSKVGDPVSASEVIDEFLKTSGGDQVDALQEKARVYLSCTDFYHYERTVEQLIEIDPDGEPDYLRQLAMSMLERGKPEDARDVLRQLKDLEGEGTDAAEFEAGVLALAGLREDAILAYQKGIAGDPNRIESWLLLGNLLKDAGQTARAIGIYQHLAETAEKDDLFTIAIDGLLNLEAPPATLAWAKRITFERIAARKDKSYLYQLVADLSEAANDGDGVLLALESSLSIAGERRSSILRELVDRAAGSQDVWSFGAGGDKQKHLAFSRRLVGLGEIVPPDVFLNLGEIFLEADDPSAALRTFRMATDLPDQGAFDRQTAEIFEQAGYAEEALGTYERVLVSEPTSAGLLVKVAEMHEHLGHNDTAADLYKRGTELQLSRQPSSSTKEERASTLTGARSWWGSRNIDDFDRYFQRNVTGVLSVLSLEEGRALALQQKDLLLSELASELADLEETKAEPKDGEQAPIEALGRFPRSFHRASFIRRLAFTFGVPELANQLDIALLDRFFPTDEALLPTLVRDRLNRGYVAAARYLLDATTRPKEATDPLRFLVGQGAEKELPKEVTVEETMRLILPLMIDGAESDAAVLLGRTMLSKDAKAGDVQALMSASMFIGNADLSLRFGRQWLLSVFDSGNSVWQLRPVLEELETILDPKEFRGICLLLTTKATENPEKAQALLQMLPDLQNKFEEPLISNDDLRELIDAKDDLGYGWGIAPVIMLLPEGERTSALRSALPRISLTARGDFLLSLLIDAKMELGATMTEYFSEIFSATLEEADVGQLDYSVDELGSLSANLEAGLAICIAILKKDSSLHAARTSRITLLEKLGRLDEALALAPDDWRAVNGIDDYRAREAKRQIETLLIEHDIDTLLLCMEQAPTDNLKADLIKRVNLLRRNDRQNQAIEILQAALEEDAEHIPFWKSLLGLRRANNDHEQTLFCYEKLIHLEPENRSHKERLMSYWISKRNSIEALAVRETLPDLDEVEEVLPADASIPGLPAGFLLPAGASMVVNGTLFIGSESKNDRKGTPTIAKVKELAESGDTDAAATMLRRLWRAFPSGISGRDRYGRINFASAGGSIPRWNWPKPEPTQEELALSEAEAKTEEVAKPNRGGFDRYKEFERTKKEPADSAYMHLAYYDFGIAEMKRILRTSSPSALNSSSARDLIAGLLSARIASSDEASVRGELLSAIASNVAGKVEHAMLLQLLDNSPELLDANSEAVLDELARTLQSGDLGPLRALARLHGRRGDTRAAIRIYRWCASKVQPVTNYFMADTGDMIDARDLLEEVKETLNGDDLFSVVEDIVFYSTSGGDGWERGENELFTMQTWKDMVSPEEALLRCGEVLKTISLTDFSAPPPRQLAKQATALYLQVGHTERALECLEIALATFDRSLFVGVDYLWPDPERPGLVGAPDLLALFPEDSSAYPNAVDWYKGVAAALAEWHGDERVTVYEAARMSAFAALRLAQLGENEAAIAVVTTAMGWDDVPSNALLYLIDAAREAGADELAFSVERSSYEKGELILERVAEVVAGVHQTEGAEAALAIGDDLLVYTRHPGILSALVDAAAASGDESRLVAMQELQARAKAADEHLEELQKALAEARRAEKAKSK